MQILPLKWLLTVLAVCVSFSCRTPSWHARYENMSILSALNLSSVHFMCASMQIFVITSFMTYCSLRRKCIGYNLVNHWFPEMEAHLNYWAWNVCTTVQKKSAIKRLLTTETPHFRGPAVKVLYVQISVKEYLPSGLNENYNSLLLRPNNVQKALLLGQFPCFRLLLNAN